MTRKDYVSLAKNLSIDWSNLESDTEDARHGFKTAVNSIESALKSDNEHFDKKRFREAVYGA